MVLALIALTAVLAAGVVALALWGMAQESAGREFDGLGRSEDRTVPGMLIWLDSMPKLAWTAT
jgi:hypothetical protein